MHLQLVVILRASVAALGIASVTMLATLAGCSGAADPVIHDLPTTASTSTSPNAQVSDPDSGTSGASADSGTDDDAAASTFGQTAVARATEWVTAQMPYCGGPNGGADLICGGTCERSGSADTPEWNPYRSDCSGLVSWAWALPAPGHTTGDFAPYDTSVSHEINGTDLQPGDALNNSEHVMLFAGWVDKAKGEATIIEESDCGLNALRKTITFTIGDTPTTPIDDTTGRVFYAIRYGS